MKQNRLDRGLETVDDHQSREPEGIGQSGM